MRSSSIVYAATAAAAAASCNPSLEVPACPSKGTVQYDKSMPEGEAFPLTQVDLCYDESALQITFTAYNETNFYTNGSYGTNDPIYEYEVMEAFIYRGTSDPQSYLELEVSPHNVTFQAFIYNPSKVRAAGAAFDRFYITDLAADGIAASTTLDRDAGTWVSDVQIPLGLFSVDNGTAKNTKWRMNFFRTVTGPDTFPNQTYGGWSVPDEANFHMTPYFGEVAFI